MDSSLILSVAGCDLQRVMDLLCEGADPDLVTGDGLPLLHLAVSHEDPEQALALAQLLLVHGARLDTRGREGLSALEVAESLGRWEIIRLLRSYGITNTSGRSNENNYVQNQTLTTFQRYIFDDRTTEVRGNKFLEEVANLFVDNIKGVKDDFPSDKLRGRVTNDAQTSSSSLSQPKTFLCLGETNLARSRMICSTLTRGKSPVTQPLEISHLSFIGQLGPQGDQSAVNTTGDMVSGAGGRDLSQDPFHSCLTEANCDSSISFTQQYLIEDKSEGVTMTEQRHSSALGIAGKNCSLCDQTSETLMPSPDLNTTYTLSSNKDEVTLFNSVSSTKFPGPLARSLADVRNITRKWDELSRMEVMMSDKFSNISNSAADLVNQLTRETACKASFNYLLLDPGISSNLPMMVFHESEQNLWIRFINSVFYIGKGSRSRPFQHLYEAIKTFRKASSIKKLSEKISRIHKIWESGGGVVVVQVFQNTIAVEAFTREAAMIEAMGCDNLTNLKPGDLYGAARGWGKVRRLELGTFLVYKAFKIFLHDGERQIRPADVKN